MVKEIIYSLDEQAKIIEELKILMQKYHIFTCSGPLGAGKTTTIKALLRNCGITETITSPTFTYVNAYKNKQNECFYHFDLYRIGSVDEFQAQGFDEYLYPSIQLQPALFRGPHEKRSEEWGQNSWAFIEWPEIIMPLLTRDVCFLFFDYHEDPEKRVIRIET